MPDLRFFAAHPFATLEEAASLVGVDAPGVQGSVTRVASYEEENLEDAAVYCSDRAAMERLAGRRFGLCLTTAQLAEDAGALAGPVWAVGSPKLAFARLSERLHYSLEDDGPAGEGEANVSPDADIHPSVSLGAGTEIAAGVRIGAFCRIGCGVTIGEGTRIEAGSTVTHAVLGKNVRLLSGARIGQAGFGFVEGPQGLVRVPQLGRVIIGDGVEVGANSTIDRGALGDTVIGEGVKIDNLVQIGHNVRVGRYCVMASQTGISGSCIIGDGVFMGGQVGLADHLTIGDGAQIAARAGLMRDVPAGERWGGFPARSVKEWLRETAALAKLAKQKNR